MRLAAMLFATLVTASAFPPDAHACSSLTGRPSRSDASTQHDKKVDEWLKTLLAEFAADPDPEIAWTGRLLSTFEEDEAGIINSPPAGSGLTRLLQFLQCEEQKACNAPLSDWMAAEPDNAFVLALAMTRDDEAIAAEARDKLARATRYDDHTLALRKLITRITARYDTVPPAEPRGYEQPSCRFVPDARLETLLNFVVLDHVGDQLEEFSLDTSVDPEVRLRLAERMLGTTGSPFAALIGAKLGASASAPIDRDRWCRLATRADSAGESIGALLLPSDDKGRALRIDFERALATRNAFDALDTVAGRLPADDRPEPPDEEAVAACIAGKSDES